tara:strand:- start:15626 stop:16435 length:810 start_codon:yes stop_codon:yes gene_type:complete
MRFQDLLGLLLIFSAGLIHGANDIQLLQKRYLNTHFIFFLLLISFYLAIVLLGGFLFFYLPKFGLFFFILFSGFHFGEQHWSSFLNQQKASMFLNKISFTFYGLLIFALLFIIHIEEVKMLIQQISGLTFSVNFFYWSALILGIGFSVLAIFLPINFRLFVKEILALVFLCILFSNTSLLLSFSAYFVFWHSIPSIHDQILYLNNEVSTTSLKNYFKSSFLYWMMSLLGLFVFYFYFDIDSDYFIPLFFTFLAAITFPHTIVIGILEFE